MTWNCGERLYIYAYLIKLLKDPKEEIQIMIFIMNRVRNCTKQQVFNFKVTSVLIYSHKPTGLQIFLYLSKDC